MDDYAERLKVLLEKGVERQIDQEETRKAVGANNIARLRELGYSLQDLSRYYRKPRYVIARYSS